MRKVATFAVGVIAAVLVLSGCSVPTVNHVGQGSAGMFFDLPRGWQSISPDVLKKAQTSWGSTDGGQAYLDALKWQGVWSGAESLTPQQAFSNAAPEHPVVYASVRSLYDVEVQNVAGDVLTALQDVVLPVSAAASGDGLDVVSNQSYVQNGLDAVKQQVSWSTNGVSQTIDVRLVLSTKKKLLFTLWIRCSDVCRDQNSTAIANALDTLTIKEPSVG